LTGFLVLVLVECRSGGGTFFKSFEDSMGTSVSAVSRAAMCEKLTVMAIGPKSIPAIPSTKMMGRNTTTWAEAEAITAVPTSAVPCFAASTIPMPFSR